MSPLGELYSREVERLHLECPALETSTLDWVITLSLARAFLTADMAELTKAMVEGSPSVRERPAAEAAVYITRTVEAALTRAARERDSYRE